MKRTFSLLLAAALLLFSLVSCGQTSPAPSASATPSAEPALSSPSPTPEPDPIDRTAQALEAFPELYRQAKQYAGTDFDAFAALFTDTTTTDELQSVFTYKFPSDGAFDHILFIPVLQSEDSCWISTVEYIVAGQHPNTHRSAHSINLPVTYQNGQWKLDNSAATVASLNELYQSNAESLFPAEYVDASVNGRNAVFLGSDYMFLGHEYYYEGCSDTQLRLAWQNEDGSVSLLLSILNGTDQNIYYSTAKFSMDSEVGEVFNVTNWPVVATVRSHYSDTYILTIPADSVQTGTAPWGQVQTHLDAFYK